MMTDTVFLPSSSWMNDLWLPRDSLLPEGCDLVPELPFQDLESEGNTPLSDRPDWKAPWDVTPSSYHPSDISIANSECSEELVGDIDLDLEDRMFMEPAGATSGLLTAVVVGAMQEDLKKNNISSLSSDIIKWQDGLLEDDDDEEDDEILYDSSNEFTMTNSTCLGKSLSPHKRSLSVTLSHNTKWSCLDKEEQRTLVDGLSGVISTNLGLREQLEVIRILNPHANVSPLDTEFVIDMTTLNDEKLLRVQTFVKQHLHQNNSNNNNNNNNNSHCRNSISSERSRTQHSTRSKKFCCHDSHSCEVSLETREGMSMSNRRRAAKYPSNQSSLKERRRLERKRSRQDLKEKRSGLFTREQVLTVTAESDKDEEDDDDDPEEVDILT